MFSENLKQRQGQELKSWPETGQISSVNILAAHHNKHPPLPDTRRTAETTKMNSVLTALVSVTRTIEHDGDSLLSSLGQPLGSRIKHSQFSQSWDKSLVKH